MSSSGVQAPSPLPTKSNSNPLGTNRSTNIVFAGKTPLGKTKDKSCYDRFIPNRSALDVQSASMNLHNENRQPDQESMLASPSRDSYQKLLAATMDVSEDSRILAFKHKVVAPPDCHGNGLKALYNQTLAPGQLKKPHRHIPQTHERVLDAPELVDDYYLNLLDWSCTNIVAVALGKSVYLWNATSGTVDELCTLPNDEDYISSLSWASDGNFLAVGTSDAKVQIWDASRAKQLRELHGHNHRVSCLSWNESILSSGGRDGVINNWDVRKRKDQACIKKLHTHEQEICGLKWSPSGQQLASGGNDNLLCIWDASFNLQHRCTAHQAAVKALAWCPFQSNLLASGGGSADRTIKFWNTVSGAMLNSVDTGSQVCGLEWNRHEKEILSSHGFSKNQLCLWKYPSMAKIGEMTGHTQRVLHMAQSPDGSMVVTAAADETIRFWKCFGEPQAKQHKAAASGASSSFNSSRLLR